VTIDTLGLPGRALLDSSVAIPALRRESGDEICADFLDAMVDSRREVLIAAPTLAEILRGDPDAELPRTRYVRVVSFDQVAAHALGVRFPPATLKEWRDAEGAPLDYYKYDALIIATAVRYRVDAFISRDDRQLRFASSVGLTARLPTAFEQPQLELLR
jgi:predicted nucleic acid-binding protein